MLANSECFPWVLLQLLAFLYTYTDTEQWAWCDYPLTILSAMDWGMV